MSDWQEAPLGECLEELLDYRGKSPPKSEVGIPVLSAKVVKTKGLITPITQKISPDFYPKWMVRGLPKAGDVVFTTEGPLGEVIQLDDETVSHALGQRIVCLRGKEGLLDNRFLKYLLTSRDQQAILASYATGTTVLGISQAALRSVPICFPRIDEQIRIAEALGSLDDKIELNRRMNETLEAMAQAIFKDWFIDFGPVRRKAEGVINPVAILGGLIQDADHAAEIASLFPNKLSENGMPEGWAERSLLELADWVNGAAYKNMHFVPEQTGLPVVKIAELKAGVTKQTKFTDTDLGDKYRIADDELLFSWSGNPDTSIDAFIWTGGSAWLNQHIFAVRPNGKRSKPFLYVMLKYLMPEFAELARNKQTTGLGHVTKADMKRMLVPDASPQIIEAFSGLIEPIFGRVVLSLHENQTLAETRNYLLPKLMSGEVRVKVAEEQADN